MSVLGPTPPVYLPFSTASQISLLLMLSVTGLRGRFNTVPELPKLIRFGPTLPAVEWRVRPMPPPLTPIEPIIAATATNACPVDCALLTRAEASLSMKATGLVCAISSANERIFSGGTPQISDCPFRRLGGIVRVTFRRRIAVCVQAQHVIAIVVFGICAFRQAGPVEANRAAIDEIPVNQRVGRRVVLGDQHVADGEQHGGVGAGADRNRLVGKHLCRMTCNRGR